MLNQLLRLPLAVKCGFIAALICAAAGLTLLISSMTASKQILLNTTELIGQQWAEQLASQSQQALLRNDRLSLQAILQDYTDNPLVVHGSIRNAQGDALAESGLLRDNDLNYHAEVTAGGGLGTVELSLSQALISEEISDLGKTLLILTIILSALSYALVAVPARKVEDYLNLARSRLAQPLRDDANPYPADDNLGKLLQEIHDPQIRLAELDASRFQDYYLLHSHWQEWDTLKERMTPDSFQEQVQTSIARAEAIARLYHGELIIERHNAVTLRFFELDDTDPPLFRALCCANLFVTLDKIFKARPGIARVCCEGDKWQCRAMECETLDRLNSATAEGTGTWLDNNCRNHERLDAWVNHRGQRAGGMKPPYDELLERQQLQLKKLDLSALRRGAQTSEN